MREVSRQPPFGRPLLVLLLCAAALLLPATTSRAATLTATAGTTFQVDLAPGDGALTISDSPLSVTFALAAGTFTATPMFTAPCVPPAGASVNCSKSNVLLGAPPSQFEFAALTVNGTTGVDSVTNQVDEPAPSDTTASLGDAADTWMGSTGDEIVMGGGGGDSLTGGSGATGLLGEGGDDPVLSGGDGDDSIEGGDGNDTMQGGNGNDSLLGQANDDVIGGGMGDDAIRPGTGNDDIDGGEGAEALGDDLDYSERVGGVTVNLALGDAMGEAGEDDEYSGGGAGSIERLLGGSGNDVLTGDAFANVLFGNAGNDTTNGGDGDDRLEGGSGNDSMLGGTGIDSFFARDGDDMPMSADGLAELVDCGTGNDTPTADSIDTLNACEGQTPPPEAVQCKGKTATIVGTAGKDNLKGTGKDDVIAALGGGDKVRAGGGDDLVCGNKGGDDLGGGSGNDQLVGGNGTDRFRGGKGNDRCNGSSKEREQSC